MAGGNELSAAPSWTVAVLLLLLVTVSEVFIMWLEWTRFRFERSKSRFLLEFLHHLHYELSPL
jgi:uncharacterized membrane protein